MAIGFEFRKKTVKSLSPKIGVYILCDLDNVPMYVGQSSDGIRQRVQRHLTSARSDIIANRQLDVWEIAYVWEYPVEAKAEMNGLEAILFHHFDPISRLVNGSSFAIPTGNPEVPSPNKIVQDMHDQEISEKRTLELRLPRQASHYAQIVSHFLAVKNSDQIARAMDAHFQRLQRYHSIMLGLSTDDND